MTAVIGRVWGWVRPWGSSAVSENTTAATTEGQKTSSRGLRGLTSWVWGACKSPSDQTNLVEEYWEAQEKLQPMEIEDLGAGKQEAKAEHVPKWWNKFLPASYFFWSRQPESSGLRRRKYAGWNQTGWDSDNEGEFSDYGTPPPSPTPPSSQLMSPLRLFATSWKGEILPEHYEICFNFLRHLFDLFVVGFLWTVSPPTKVILEVLGVHGALRLWFHGMAMFFVSTVGMAGLLWLIQEYLPQFALIYGIVQALVISVSIRQSVLLGEEEEEQEEKEDEVKEGEGVKDSGEHKEKHVFAKDKIKPGVKVGI
ncbi:uncharacterized protein C6orf47 homolog [Centroberyx affinis]|uniref:uncharacterized protein C6orf47 homolog n=1 Tax=Centroberyx affinis TaxID=166261 RepID=UPI003A5C43CD